MEFVLFENDENVEELRLRRQLRDASNPLEISDDLFIKNYRLSKDAFCYVLNVIECELKTSSKRTAIPNILKLAATLRFCAQGSYQMGVGNECKIGLAQSTVSLVLKETFKALEKKALQHWIKFSTSEEDIQESRVAFYGKTGMPGVIGCIDGTHIKIVGPKKDVQHLYYNRKGYHSINAMVVCDHKMRITYINARFPGSSHDSAAFQMSLLRPKLEELARTQENAWLLGDSGYPLRPYLLTPYRAAPEGSAQRLFNLRHAQARCIVERTIGVLKNRFRCLLGARALHYAPDKATQIINVCVALHNICIRFNVANDDVVVEEYETPEEYGEQPNQNEGEQIRDNIMRSLEL